MSKHLGFNINCHSHWVVDLIFPVFINLLPEASLSRCRSISFCHQIWRDFLNWVHLKAILSTSLLITWANIALIRILFLYKFFTCVCVCIDIHTQKYLHTSMHIYTYTQTDSNAYHNKCLVWWWPIIVEYNSMTLHIWEIFFSFFTSWCTQTFVVPYFPWLMVGCFALPLFKLWYTEEGATLVTFRYLST